MRTSSAVALAAVLALSAVACGSSGSDPAGASRGNGSSGASGTVKTDAPNGCSFVTAPPVAPEPDPNAAPETLAIARAVKAVDSKIGSYLRGEIIAYRGTMKAHDNASATANVEVYGPRPDGDIAEGPALARVDVRDASTGDWSPPRQTVSGQLASLVLRSVGSKSHVILGQLAGEPATTFATSVGAEREFVTLQSTCSGCLPDLTARPATLSFQELTTTGTVSSFQGYAGKDGAYVDVTVHTTTSATLTRVAPCDVRFEDMVALNVIAGPNESNAGLEEMTDAGDELVWKLVGSIGDAAGHKCSTITPYTIEAFVKKSDLGTYGARNFKLGAATQNCAP